MSEVIYLSRSTLNDLLSKTPFHAWLNHPQLNPNYVSEEKAAYDIGTAAHSLLLEGIDCVEVIEADDWRTKAAKEARDLAYKDGKTPLLLKNYIAVKEMVRAAERQISECKELDIIDLESQGFSEQTYTWKESGIDYKSRLDWISKDKKLILDYKTTGISANPEDFGRSIISAGLDIQESLYRQAVKKVDGIDAKFVFCVQETEPPYLMSFIALPPEFQAMGESKIIKGSILWQECMAANDWPAYPKRICYPDLPVWALNQWESKIERMGL